jgi:hypothetical protein
VLARLVLRPTSRARGTASGIAFAVAVFVAALLLVDGLAVTAADLADRAPSGPVLASSAPSLAASRVDADVRARLVGDHALVHRAPATVGGEGIVVVAVDASRYADLLAFVPPADVVYLGPDLAASRAISVGDVLTVEGSAGTAALRVGRILPRDAPFPATWAVVPLPLLVGDAPPFPSEASFLLLAPDAADDVAMLRAAGYAITPLLAAPAAAEAALLEARSALLGLVALAAAVAALLAYHGLALEVHERRREIATLRHLGAGPGVLRRLFLARALLLATVGGVFGLALGVVAAHAVASFAPLLGLPHLLRLAPGPTIDTLALLVPLADVLPAALAASRHASRLAREVAPSS